jgi:hypothetical protein
VLDLTQRHTTLRRTPLDGGSARRDPYLTTRHSQETDIHAPAVFEPTIPASERPQTHALDRTATGIGFVTTRSSCYACSKRLRFATVRGM